MYIFEGQLDKYLQQFQPSEEINPLNENVFTISNNESTEENSVAVIKDQNGISYNLWVLLN